LSLSDGQDVLEGLLSSGEWLIGNEFDHLRESLQGADRLLDFGKVAASLIVLFLLKEAIA